jgi:lipopolysaccharide/colanic/teichoic acid biosynthesis glycosyltransferase
VTTPIRLGTPATETVAERTARLASENLAPRRVDAALRALDLALAGVGIVVLAPVSGLVALAVRLLCGRPVLYRGRRVGLAGRTFTIYKFRTLQPDAEQRLGPFAGRELDDKVPAETTRIGGVLRSTHLDELPQLYNVLRGDMAVVGPRPIRPAFFAELAEDIPQYWQRLVVRPGLTGFAQLRMTRSTTWAEKLAHDLEYIADRSVTLYLRVVADTAVRVLGRLLGSRPAA